MKLPSQLLVAILSLLTMTLPAAGAGAGFVPVRNFGRDIYGSGTQNWECVQEIGRAHV